MGWVWETLSFLPYSHTIKKGNLFLVTDLRHTGWVPRILNLKTRWRCGQLHAPTALTPGEKTGTHEIGGPRPSLGPTQPPIQGVAWTGRNSSFLPVDNLLAQWLLPFWVRVSAVTFVSRERIQLQLWHNNNEPAKNTYNIHRLASMAPSGCGLSDMETRFDSQQEQEDFHLLHSVLTGSGAHPEYYAMCTGSLWG